MQLMILSSKYQERDKPQGEDNKDLTFRGSIGTHTCNRDEHVLSGGLIFNIRGRRDRTTTAGRQICRETLPYILYPERAEGNIIRDFSASFNPASLKDKK